MNIQPVNNTNFKSTYPVVHWVAETNGSYAPVANLQIVKKLQGKIIRMLNKPLVSSTKPMEPLEQRLRAYIGVCDADYRNNPNVRSFYNRTDAAPVSYVISGDDVGIFENNLAKNIGRAKSNARELLSKPYSPETMEAIKLYNREGLKFVQNNSKQIQDKNGMMYILHTKFEIIRNRMGKIKDYKFVEARFLPARGQGSSLGKM
ncbi:MAG: hypothetical protein KIC88_02770 [Acinetobacter sp.]|nr:hypothetical protein [Acinetobacter sp.]DAB01407.1 MAG TPA: hypothetical protein CPT96_04010 [Candidatus Gastranaerophilales bacterium HUM_10]DAB10606.1 MAG TPA: hypothetical protein CPT91_08815 [Candidatus Gastranaerophilales bacterium HUM_16]